MPALNSFVSSSSRVPFLNAEEVGERLKLDPETIDWLKEEPVNGDNPILVLGYQNVFLNLENFESKKQAVSTALTDSGATLVNDNVFKFDDWLAMYAARDNMMMNMSWCFYTSNSVWAQQIGLSQQATITTTVITWFPEITGKLTIQPYEFFKL